MPYRLYGIGEDRLRLHIYVKKKKVKCGPVSNKLFLIDKKCATGTVIMDELTLIRSTL